MYDPIYAKAFDKITELTAEKAHLVSQLQEYRSGFSVAELDMASQIAKLTAALQSIAANTCCDRCQEAALVARAALPPATETPNAE